MPRRNEYISIGDEPMYSRPCYRPIENDEPTVSQPIYNARETGAFTAVPGKLGHWYHVPDLDRLFTRVYEYHQRGGFFAMVLGDCLELIQFIFIVWMSTFLFQCVNYPVLFRNKTLANHTKITFDDIVYSQCAANLNLITWICLLIAFIFWLMRLVRVIFQFTQHKDVRDFYNNVLNIKSTDELENLTWSDVMSCLCDAQHKVQLCIHKEQLTELDIYQRILRHKNYLVAMVNKNLLPPTYKLPFVGELHYFPTIFKANLNWLLFEGPFSPWKDYYSLKSSYKDREQLHQCSIEMDKTILYLGIGNLVLSPIIFLYQILKSFFDTAQLVKRQPRALGMRMFSNYGRYYTRHFNELPHELTARLNRAHRPATQYMDQFSSRTSELIARHAAVIFGALFAVIAALSVWDEDVLQVEHVLTVMTLSGLIVYACSIFIPDENLVWCPQLLLDTVIAHIHYAPLNWKDNAHTERVRYEFSQLFQFRIYFILEELVSPFITPFVLLFWLRPRAHLFVKFFYEYTVNESGVGDICSFAQLDVGGRHSDKKWHRFVNVDSDQPVNLARQQRLTTPNDIDMACDGKMEMSTMHFAVVNPNWQPTTKANRVFIENLKKQITTDAHKLTMSRLQTLDNTNIIASSIIQSPHDTINQSILMPVRGRGIRNQEGSLMHSINRVSLMSSIRESGLFAQTSLQQSNELAVRLPNVQVETAAFEMSHHCLFLRDATNDDRLEPYSNIEPDVTNSNNLSITSMIRPPTLDTLSLQQSTLPRSNEKRRLSTEHDVINLIDEAEEAKDDAPLQLWGVNSTSNNEENDDDERPPTSFGSA